MRTSWFLVCLLIALASGQTPPSAGAKKDYLDRRAAVLRQIAEVKAKLAALEVELQVLEESRPADTPAPSPTAWREEPGAAAAGSETKKAAPRCLSVTRDGKRCTRQAEAGTKYCWQHRNH